jgi:hypothetical protein
MTGPKGKRPCQSCGHDYWSHDTGWDAVGCMMGDCLCRSFCELSLDEGRCPACGEYVPNVPACLKAHTDRAEA